MNYITSCPKCETQFLLSTEHLKAHRGKVQCGHCEHVFNAKNRVTEISDDIHSTEEYRASLEQPVDGGEAGVDENIDVAENASEQVVEEIEITDDNGPYVGDFSHAVSASNVRIPRDAPTVIEDLVPSRRVGRKNAKSGFASGLLAFFLLLAAAIQSLYFMRTSIAAEYPPLKPFLVQACLPLKCEVGLPKHLDLLLIDDSDMQENDTYEGVINFSSLLINNASYAQMYPNIELTLTDNNDQPALRRIITPAEYLGSNANIKTGIGPREEVRIKLSIFASNTAVAGYRVLLVY